LTTPGKSRRWQVKGKMGKRRRGGARQGGGPIDGTFHPLTIPTTQPPVDDDDDPSTIPTTQPPIDL